MCARILYVTSRPFSTWKKPSVHLTIHLLCQLVIMFSFAWMMAPKGKLTSGSVFHWNISMGDSLVLAVQRPRTTVKWDFSCRVVRSSTDLSPLLRNSLSHRNVNGILFLLTMSWDSCRLQAQSPWGRSEEYEECWEWQIFTRFIYIMMVAYCWMRMPNLYSSVLQYIKQSASSMTSSREGLVGVSPPMPFRTSEGGEGVGSPF